MTGEIEETIAEVVEIEEVVVIAEAEDSTEENVEVKRFRVPVSGLKTLRRCPRKKIEYCFGFRIKEHETRNSKLETEYVTTEKDQTQESTERTYSFSGEAWRYHRVRFIWIESNGAHLVDQPSD
jgi:hypothetical protein